MKINTHIYNSASVNLNSVNGSASYTSYRGGYLLDNQLVVCVPSDKTMTPLILSGALSYSYEDERFTLNLVLRLIAKRL